MFSPKTTRRAVLSSTILAAPALMLGSQSMAESAPPTDGTFEFEVTKTESEWRDQLSDTDYRVLREGATEAPRSHPLWLSEAAGMYSCKGCGLDVYDARWKVLLDKGWLFFRHSQANAVLTNVDLTVDSDFQESDVETIGSMMDSARVEGLSAEAQESLDSRVAIEAHCRRCGSHFGHILQADGMLLHCVNGRSFYFEYDEA